MKTYKNNNNESFNFEGNICETIFKSCESMDMDMWSKVK